MRQTAIHVTILLVLVAIAALTLRGIGNQTATRSAEDRRKDEDLLRMEKKLTRLCETVDRQWELATTLMASPDRAPVAETARIVLVPLKDVCDRPL